MGYGRMNLSLKNTKTGDVKHVLMLQSSRNMALLNETMLRGTKSETVQATSPKTGYIPEN